MKVLLLVEPTPFNYVSGYANRFKEMLKYLKNAGDEVSIITPDADPNRPTDFLGYPITSARGFEFPLYKFVTVTFDLKGNVLKLIKEFKPDIIHVSSPSAILNPAILWARLLDVPLLMSYHTDLVSYARAYANVPGSIELAKFCIGYYHQFADLVLCTSPQLQETLTQAGVRRVDVWQKGINTEVFSPTFRDAKMRARLSDGHPEAPLLLYVGRLGYEKKLDRLKAVLDANPGARLALVGKGPAEADLRELFRDYPVHFAGQVVGEELSQAYASVDIFTMPSDSETLGFVVMESMASGVPVVGVGAGGVVDLIQPMKTGLLAVNKDDMVQFSRHVKDLIADEPLRKQMGQQGWEWAQGWSWEAATARLRNVHYRRAIAIHRSRDESGAHVREIEDALMQRI
ncbi:hypothetical protein B484DRAFT_323599 [Ochromonadaceae sp. CCMP2298]|nr:hypothetical protein B484DRAFT_323599 [Ochromonadaceae sp. CCMP2298]